MRENFQISRNMFNQIYLIANNVKKMPKLFELARAVKVIATNASKTRVFRGGRLGSYS